MKTIQFISLSLIIFLPFSICFAETLTETDSINIINSIENKKKYTDINHVNSNRKIDEINKDENNDNKRKTILAIGISAGIIGTVTYFPLIINYNLSIFLIL